MSELVFTGTGDAAHDAAIRYRARMFEGMSEAKRRTDRSSQPLRKLVERVYTSNLTGDPKDVVLRNVWEIIGTLYPGCVISARSAAITSPAKQADDPDAPAFVFLTGNYRRNVSLPGLELRIAEGPGQLQGDTDFMGLYLASPARQCLENLFPSRARSGVSRTTGDKAVERYLTQRCLTSGEDSLNEIRDQAREIKDDLDADEQFETLNGMISSLLRTNTLEALNTTQGKALVAGEPFDNKCVDRLNILWAYLASNTMPRRPNNAAGREAAINTAFIEAYFSNYIEGTHFLIEEAEEMVFEGKIPEARPKDSHDVLSTFRQLSDISGLRRLPSNADDFVSALKARHKLLMGARSEDLPGQFKPTRNKAGNTVFVEPHLVLGTLKQGYKLLQGLREPFARAVFVHFLVSDVHPFLDGNGRVSRIMMTSELEAGGLSRVVIPTVFRNEYLNGQRSMTRFSDPAANFKAIDKAQEITAKITEDDRADFLNLWASTYAFVEEGEHARLELPDPDREIHWKDGIPAPSQYWRDMDGGTSFVP